MYLSRGERVFIILFLLLCAIFLLNIGYARSDSNYSNIINFDIQFKNPQIINCIGVDRNKTFIKTSLDSYNLYINIPELQYPGAGVEFSVDIQNNGTLDAKIDSITTSSFEKSKVFKFKWLNEDIYKELILKPGDSTTVYFLIEWDKNVNIYTDESVDFNITVNCSQAI